MGSKRYTVALCLCDNDGMTFNKRRQSRDRLLIEDLCSSTQAPIFIEEYSLPLFEGLEDRIQVVKKIPEDVPDNGLIFTERVSPELFLGDTARLIIYRWGRKYPADLKFTIKPEEVGFTRIEEYEFVGSSHEKITKGVYER